MEEMRRLGSGTVPASGPARRSAAPAADAGQAPAGRAHQRSARGAARALRRRERRRPLPRTPGRSRGASAASSRRSTRRRSRAEERVEHAGRDHRSREQPRRQAARSSGRARRGCSTASPASTRTPPKHAVVKRTVRRRCDASPHRAPAASRSGSLALRTRPSNCAPSAMTRFFWTMSPLMRAVAIERDRLGAQLPVDLAVDGEVARADRAGDLAGLADSDVVAVDVAR